MIDFDLDIDPDGVTHLTVRGERIDILPDGNLHWKKDDTEVTAMGTDFNMKIGAIAEAIKELSDEREINGSGLYTRSLMPWQTEAIRILEDSEATWAFSELELREWYDPEGSACGFAEYLGLTAAESEELAEADTVVQQLKAAEKELEATQAILQKR